jgi:hypothetical protein
MTSVMFVGWRKCMSGAQGNCDLRDLSIAVADSCHGIEREAKYQLILTQQLPVRSRGKEICVCTLWRLALQDKPSPLWAACLTAPMRFRSHRLEEAPLEAVRIKLSLIVMEKSWLLACILFSRVSSRNSVPLQVAAKIVFEHSWACQLTHFQSQLLNFNIFEFHKTALYLKFLWSMHMLIDQDNYYLQILHY